MSFMVPFNDLSRIHAPLAEELNKAIHALVSSNHFILGPEVTAFEGEFAQYCEAKHAIGVSSGTDALLISLMALNIEPGDEVITTPFTFFATAGVISRLRAIPVFVDIEPDSFNLDPDEVESKISSKTKAIIGVHLFGQMANMDALEAISARHGVPLIEDAAQSVGAQDGRGRRAGSIGTLNCFSFFPAKNLGCFGDGGCVTTQDDALAEKLRALRVHGAKVKYYHEQVGGNFRLDALQAAVLRVKLPHLEAWTEQRIAAADRMRKALRERNLHEWLTLAPPRPGRHVYNQLVGRTKQRDRVVSGLRERQVGAMVYYPKSLHLQPCFSELGYVEGDFPHTENACKEVLALPNFPGMTHDETERVADALAILRNEAS